MAINYDVEYPKLQGCVAELDKAKTNAYSEIRLMAKEIEELQAKLDAVERLTRYNCVRGLAGGRAVEPDPAGQFILAEDVLKALSGAEVMSDCMSPVCGMGDEICSSCAKDKRIEEQQQLLELWMLYYTDGMPDDELRDLYCDSIEALEDE